MQFSLRFRYRMPGVIRVLLIAAIICDSANDFFRFIAPELFPGFFRPEVRYPYLDRRLVEYLFAIPHFQKQRPGESRSLMRRAFRSLLPSEIIHRETKGTIDEAICRALRSAWEAVTLVVNRKFVDQRAFADAVNDVMYGGKTNRGDILRLISLQIFLRGKNILGQGNGQPNFALSQGAAFRDLRTGGKSSVAAMRASLPHQSGNTLSSLDEKIT